MKRHGYCKGGRVPAELKAWYEMKARCYTPSNKKYSHYGARGIAVCMVREFPTFEREMWR